MLEKLKVEDFAGRVGERFRLDPGEGPTLDLELTEARGMPGGSDRRQPFSLVFRGPAEPLLAQRIWRLEHTDLGALDIFLVPIGGDEKGMRYEAVFS